MSPILLILPDAYCLGARPIQSGQIQIKDGNKLT
ncbi:MAG: hypothetical protein ACJAWQ_001467 [Paraglaciecola sp.]|jgi:hypothetical protein